MLQKLAKCSFTRCATANVIFGPSPSITYASRRSYATRLNESIINLLKECEEKEKTSVTRNQYKTRSLRMAAAAVEKLDFEVQHGDDLKGISGIGPGIRSWVNIFLGHEVDTSNELRKKRNAIKELMTVPGLGEKSAKALYDNGCDTIAKLHFKKYKESLTPGAKRGLKYIRSLKSPMPRENAEAIVEFYKYFLAMDKYEIVIAGDYRRGAPSISGTIEILIIDGSMTDPIPTPPHPSTLKPPNPGRPTRIGLPFAQPYIVNEERNGSVLLNKIIRPLEDLGVVCDTTAPGVNVWQGWMRVPKKSGGSWESRKERTDGIQTLNGDFHRVNVTYVPKQSRGSALLATTGDGDYYVDCMRKAVQAGLYLNEWGLWEWEPDSQSLSRFETSDAPYEKTSLGAMWGSETEADKGRWVKLEAVEEEEILNAIGGEYVPPDRRNFSFISAKKGKKKKRPISMSNP